ncbi:MAG: GGDEF domain-containing protein [Nanoarchaeota archaeon]
MITKDLELLMESLPPRIGDMLRRATQRLPNQERESVYVYLLGLEHIERIKTVRFYNSITTPEDKKIFRVMMARQVTDHLTGLYNRFHFDNDLELTICEVEREYQRENRVKNSGKVVSPDASLLFLDIDYFKRVNDTYGHPVGDDTLKEVASWIKKSLRREDTRVSRLGGEEIGVILKQTSLMQGREVAERIRRNIETNLGNYLTTRPVITRHAEYDPPIGLTVSIGIANYKETCDRPLISIWKQQADAALYRAKQNGRNRVEVFTP